METLGYILGILSFLFLWDFKLFQTITMRKTKLGYEYRNDFTEQLNIAPLNCAPCLSGWIGVILFLITLNIYFLSLPILYKFLTK